MKTVMIDLIYVLQVLQLYIHKTFKDNFCAITEKLSNQKATYLLNTAFSFYLFLIV